MTGNIYLSFKLESPNNDNCQEYTLSLYQGSASNTATEIYRETGNLVDRDGRYNITSIRKDDYYNAVNREVDNTIQTRCNVESISIDVVTNTKTTLKVYRNNGRPNIPLRPDIIASISKNRYTEHTEANVTYYTCDIQRELVSEEERKQYAVKIESDNDVSAPEVGDTLTAVPAPSGETLEYVRWIRCSSIQAPELSNILSENYTRADAPYVISSERTYQITSDDIGHYIFVVIKRPNENEGNLSSFERWDYLRAPVAGTITVQKTQISPPPSLSRESRTSNSLTIGWNSDARSVGVTLMYTTLADFEANSWSNATAVTETGTSKVFGSLTPHETYIFRAKYVADPDGLYLDSEWSAVLQATTIITLEKPRFCDEDAVRPDPDNPGQYIRGLGRLCKPTSLDTIYLEWTDVSNATQYQLYRSESQIATPSTINSANCQNIDAPASGHGSATITGLSENTRYYFYVRAVNPDDEAVIDSDWDEVSVSTKSRLATPSFNTANCSSTDNSVSLAWSAVSNATSYAIDYSTSPTFRTYFQHLVQLDPNDTITGLQPETTYYFRLVACPSNSLLYENSLPSEPISLTTQATQVIPTIVQLDTPTNVSAVQNAENIVLYWSTVENGRIYTLYITDSDGLVQTLDANLSSAYDSHLNGGSFTAWTASQTIGGLTPGMLYQFQVQAKGDATDFESSEISESASCAIRTQLPTPKIITTVYGSTTDHIVVYCTIDRNADAYEAVITGVTDPTYEDTATVIINKNAGGEQYFFFEDLESDSIYNIKIRAVAFDNNPVSLTSDWGRVTTATKAEHEENNTMAIKFKVHPILDLTPTQNNHIANKGYVDTAINVYSTAHPVGTASGDLARLGDGGKFSSDLLPVATSENFGVVKIGAGIAVNNGIISVSSIDALLESSIVVSGAGANNTTTKVPSVAAVTGYVTNYVTGQLAGYAALDSNNKIAVSALPDIPLSKLESLSVGNVFVVATDADKTNQSSYSSYGITPQIGDEVFVTGTGTLFMLKSNETDGYKTASNWIEIRTPSSSITGVTMGSTTVTSGTVTITPSAIGAFATENLIATYDDDNWSPQNAQLQTKVASIAAMVGWFKEQIATTTTIGSVKADSTAGSPIQINSSTGVITLQLYDYSTNQNLTGLYASIQPISAADLNTILTNYSLSDHNHLALNSGETGAYDIYVPTPIYSDSYFVPQEVVASPFIQAGTYSKGDYAVYKGILYQYISNSPKASGTGFVAANWERTTAMEQVASIETDVATLQSSVTALQSSTAQYSCTLNASYSTPCNGHNAVFPIAHNLNKQYVSVQIIDQTGDTCLTSITFTDANNLTVNFDNAPSASESFNVIVRY